MQDSRKKRHWAEMVLIVSSGVAVGCQMGSIVAKAFGVLDVPLNSWTAGAVLMFSASVGLSFSLLVRRIIDGNH